MGPAAEFVCCPDCRGTGSAVVKEYLDWAIAQEREACARKGHKMTTVTLDVRAE